VVLDEARRKLPDPKHSATYGLLKRIYRALACRVRGLEGDDPFALRRDLLAL
jgi:hypothetical protein